jgi:hypothetical protein
MIRKLKKSDLYPTRARKPKVSDAEKLRRLRKLVCEWRDRPRATTSASDWYLLQAIERLELAGVIPKPRKRKTEQ